MTHPMPPYLGIADMNIRFIRCNATEFKLCSKAAFSEHRNREIRPFHLLFQKLPHFRAGTVHDNSITRIIRRAEKRKSLNMIPMEMGKKEMIGLRPVKIVKPVL